MELVTLKIGPVSGGDKRTIEALAQTLGIPVQAQGDCLIVGPASKGDVRTIEAKCAELLLPAANQAEPEDEPGQDTPAPEADRLAAIEAKLDALLAALRAAAKAAEGT